MKHDFLFALVIFASACSQPATPVPVPEGATAPAASQPVIALALEPLTAADLDKKLSGELGCSFSADGKTLLVAMGDVTKTARSAAVIKRNGAAALLPATILGGYDAMVESASFAAGDVSVDVRPQTRVETGDEQVAYNATLIIRADGAEQAYEGAWTCGP